MGRDVSSQVRIKYYSIMILKTKQGLNITHS